MRSWLARWVVGVSVGAIGSLVVVSASGCGRGAFAGAAPVVRDGLELHLTALDSNRTRSLKDGSVRERLVVTGYVRAQDGGVGFTTERGIRLSEVRDEHRRNLLELEGAKVWPGTGAPNDLYPFTRPGYLQDSKRGYSCSVMGRVEGLAGPVRRLSVVRGEVHGLRITETRTLDVPLAAADDAERYVLRELAPGFWFSLDEAAVKDKRMDIGYRYWLCNDVSPEQAGKPEIGKRRHISLFLPIVASEKRPAGYSGHDSRRPPFLQQVEIVDATGTALAALDWGTVQIGVASGMYGEFNDRVPVLKSGEPVGARVTLITGVEEVVFPVELEGVGLEGQ